MLISVLLCDLRNSQFEAPLCSPSNACHSRPSAPGTNVSARWKWVMLSTALLGEEHCGDWDGTQDSPFFLLCFLKKRNAFNNKTWLILSEENIQLKTPKKRVKPCSLNYYISSRQTENTSFRCVQPHWFHPPQRSPSLFSLLTAQGTPRQQQIGGATHSVICTVKGMELRICSWAHSGL